MRAPRLVVSNPRAAFIVSGRDSSSVVLDSSAFSRTQVSRFATCPSTRVCVTLPRDGTVGGSISEERPWVLLIASRPVARVCTRPSPQTLTLLA